MKEHNVLSLCNARKQKEAEQVGALLRCVAADKYEIDSDIKVFLEQLVAAGELTPGELAQLETAMFK